jgi:hypothetical protein
VTCSRSVVFSVYSGFRHNIPNILLKVALNTIKQINKQSVIQFYEGAIQMLKLHMNTFQV